MKRLLSALAVPAFALLASCSNSPDTSTRTLQFLAKTDCELVYKAAGAQVVENFCETQWKPVTIYIAGQKYSVDWMDEETSRIVFEDGCGRTAACFYELSLDGLTINGRFNYTTKMLKGDYTFEIDANENVKLISQNTSALAS